MKPENYQIDLKTLETVLNYLAGRPYLEVAKLVDALLKLQPVVTAPVMAPVAPASDDSTQAA